MDIGWGSRGVVSCDLLHVLCFIIISNFQMFFLKKSGPLYGVGKLLTKIYISLKIYFRKKEMFSLNKMICSLGYVSRKGLKNIKLVLKIFYQNNLQYSASEITFLLCWHNQGSAGTVKIILNGKIISNFLRSNHIKVDKIKSHQRWTGHRDHQDFYWFSQVES